MSYKVEYSSEELRRDLERTLDELNIFRYNNEYRLMLGDAFMDKLALWENNIAYCKDDPFTIVVAGDFKRGKSTLINALLGEEIVATDVTTETVTLNRISYGVPSNEAVLTDNKRVKISNSELKREKLEAIMDELGESIQRLEIRRPCEFLKRVTIIDTPGTGDSMKDFSDVVKEILLQADAVIYVFNVQYPLSKSEQIFLKAAILSQKYTSLFMVGNYSDILENLDNYNRMEVLLKERVKIFLPDVDPYMISALDELCKELDEPYPKNELTHILRKQFEHLREDLNHLIEIRSDSVVLDRMQRLTYKMIKELEISLDAIDSGLKIELTDIDDILKKEKAEEEKIILQNSKTMQATLESISKMKMEANVWMGEFMQRIVDETGNLSKMSNDDLKRYYEFYCIDLLQEAFETCVEYHQEYILNILDAVDEEIRRNNAGIFDFKHMYNFRINLDNRIWTKGDTVGLAVSQIASANYLTFVASMIADGISGSMREKEKQDALPQLIEQISKKLLNMNAEVSKVIDLIYNELSDKTQKLLALFYEEQTEQRRYLLEQTIQAANKNSEEKKAVENVIVSARNVLEKIQNMLV